MQSTSNKNAIERELLAEIARVIEEGHSGISLQQGKSYYNSGRLPELIQTYINNRKISKKSFALSIGVSPQTVSRMTSDEQFSEVVLFRLQNGLLRINSEIEANQYVDGFHGDWRSTSAQFVSLTIKEVSDRLVFLKKVLETNNFARSSESPIDEIQLRQLTALVSAFLEAIKAPYIERSHLNGLLGWLKKIAKRGAEKGAEKIVQEAMDGATEALGDLFQKLEKSPAVNDLGNLT